MIGQTLLAAVTTRIIYAAHAATRFRRGVTVAYCVLVYVAVARAFFARRRHRTARLEVAVVAQLAQIALRAYSAAQTHDLGRLQLIVVDLHAWTVVGTWTLLAHV